MIINIQSEDRKYPDNLKTFYPSNLTFSIYENKKNGYCFYYGSNNMTENATPIILIDYKKMEVKKLVK
jgi:hypothetical protein